MTSLLTAGWWKSCLSFPEATLWLRKLILCKLLQSFWSTLATTFPTTSSKAIPLQLSHKLKSPFLGIGTSTASHQSTGTFLSLHTSFTSSSSSFMNSSSQQTAFSISGRMPDSPPAFPLFSFPRALCSSSSDGISAMAGFRGLCLTLPSSSTENSLWRFKILVKCLLHLCCCISGVLHVLPSSSFTTAILTGTSPLLPRCMSLMHLQTTFPPFFPLSASMAFIWNQSFFAILIARLAALRAPANFLLSLSLPGTEP